MVRMEAGDRCVIHTPGGGAWGLPEEERAAEEDEANAPVQYPRAMGSVAAYMAAQEASS
ncbi:hypothetical protein KEM56_000253 [Ascosphaera pollenicola]|nr:hypothetical protein KEM56_000253 [Ascosphaera pollenicola]